MLTANTASASPPATVESIMEAIKVLSATKPPRVGFYSTSLFPADRVIQIQDQHESLLIAGRGYWDKVKADPRVRDMKITTLTATGFPVGGVPVIDLDRNDDERLRVFAIITRKLGVRL